MRPKRRDLRLTSSPLADIGARAGYPTGRDRAEALGISRNHLYHVESGDTKLSARLADLMSQLYNCPVGMIERAATVVREEYCRRVLNSLRDIR